MQEMVPYDFENLEFESSDRKKRQVDGLKRIPEAHYFGDVECLQVEVRLNLCFRKFVEADLPDPEQNEI